MTTQQETRTEVGVECRSCGRSTRSTSRWSPVVKRGEVVGHTCPACPKYDEPIRRTENGAGVRFRVTLDKGTDAQGRRRQHTKVVSTLSEAREYASTTGSTLRAERKSGRVVAERLTFDALAGRWLESRRGEVREVTRETYAHALKPVRRRLGDRQVSSLTHADVLALRTWLAREGGREGRPLGQHAVKASLAALKMVLDHGVRAERVVTENVARGVRPPRAQAPTEAPLERWTAGELVTFTTCADADPLGAAWRLATLGMRREEVLGLRWQDVDFTAGTVSIRQTRVAVSGSTDERRWMLGRPKSAASRRTIRPDSVQPGTMLALKALRVASMIDKTTNPTGLVVVDQAGRPVVPKTFSDKFALLARDAEVPVIHLHSTRHTVAYLLHDAGVAPVRAAAFLGHTLAVHLAVYLFAGEADVDAASDALGGVLARAAAGA